MDFRKLQALCQLIELKSFTRAAQALGLSQPTVSEQIRSLEEELGQKLVDRMGREVEATPVGQLCYNHARNLLRLQSEMVQAVNQFQGLLCGTAVIGASTIPGTYILPAIINTFHRLFSAVTVQVRITSSRQTATMVLEGSCDFGFVGDRWHERGLEWQQVAEDTLCLVARPDHPLAAKTGPLVMADLFDHDVVLREQGSGTRSVVASQLEASGYKESDLRVVAWFGSNEAVREAVKAGIGLAILSACSVAEDIRQGRLVTLNLEELGFKRSFFLVHRRNKALAPAAMALMEHVLQALQSSNTER